MKDYKSLQNHHSTSFFSLPLIEISDFHIYFVFLLWFHRLSATLFCTLSLCGVVCLSCFVQLFVRFRLLDQLRSSAVPINDFGVVNAAELETWVFQRLKYSHICRLLYFAVLCYSHGDMDVVSLLATSSFLFLVNVHCIDVLYQFKWMNII